MNDLLARWRRTVRALRGLALRAAYLSSEMERAGAAASATALEELCQRAEHEDPDARETLAAAQQVVSDPGRAALVGALRLEAARRELSALGRWLGTPELEAGCAPSPAAAPVATAPSGRPLTLGERKALARRPGRATLEKLLGDPHPQVIKNLLQNPSVSEPLVVRLAARRPAHPEALAVIAAHPRWAPRASVRLALLHNPDTPPGAALPLLGLLLRHELAELLRVGDASPAVLAAAREHYLRRALGPNQDHLLARHADEELN